jgi:hypothetical protein
MVKAPRQRDTKSHGRHRLKPSGLRENCAEEAVCRLVTVISITALFKLIGVRSNKSSVFLIGLQASVEKGSPLKIAG